MYFTFDVLPVKWGSQNFEIGSCDLGHAHLGVVLWSHAGGVGPLCLYQIWSE